MWRSETYKGFEIHVLPVLDYGPPSTEGASYGYNGYVQRPGAAVAGEAKLRRFHHYDAHFPTPDAAAAAAFAEGRSIVDGAHAFLSVKGL